MSRRLSRTAGSTRKFLDRDAEPGGIAGDPFVSTELVARKRRKTRIEADDAAASSRADGCVMVDHGIADQQRVSGTDARSLNHREESGGIGLPGMRAISPGDVVEQIADAKPRQDALGRLLRLVRQDGEPSVPACAADDVLDAVE